MTLKRSQKQSNENSVIEVLKLTGDDANMTMGGIDCTKRYTKDVLVQAMEETIAAIEANRRRTITEIESIDQSLRLSLTAKQLKTPITFEKSSDLHGILSDSIFDLAKDNETVKLMTPGTLKRPRRSKSISRGRLQTIEEGGQLRQGRSSSVGARMEPYATPLLRPAAQDLMTINKYTVRKPFERTNTIPLNVKRAMRIGEEAISTSGSPLFVQSRVPCEPEVNIPLQNGMIFNIDPEQASSKIMIPMLDADTKEKIKVLCEKLQKCINN